MNDTDLSDLRQRLDAIDRRTKAIEHEAHRILLLLCVVALMITAGFWGPVPTILVLVSIPIALWCGRSATRRAQARLDEMERGTAPGPASGHRSGP